MKSHIQMPKLLLKRFEKDHRFFYYDVNKHIIGTNGHASSVNTETEYYSEDMEQYLQQAIETPFSKLLHIIDKVDLNNPDIVLNNDTIGYARNFIYALLARNPLLPSEINKHSIFFNYFPEQIKHDYAAFYGIEHLKEQRLLDDYIITFSVNRTQIPFVLPICGIYSCKIFGCNHHFMPITPEVGIVMAEKKVLSNFTHLRKIPFYLIQNETEMYFFDKKAFTTQCNLGYGTIISNERTILERLASECDTGK